MTTSHAARFLKFPIDSTKAVDELNLCEFPLTVLSDRSPKDQFELSFADDLWDEGAQERISRTLNISAPSMYGLPTAKDEEVLLALIHYTDQVNQFSDPTVHFSRYELIKLLGWDQGGKSYHRIRESLARWKSVTLNYQNAWRDHRRKSWVSEIFSLIDNVTIYERDQQRGSDGEQIDLKLSSFTWNRVFLESMQANYFKRLDFAFYQQLESATARRLYRILDKRFGAGWTTFESELRKLAFQRINLNRNYDTGKIKEKLAPAIAELEARGFIEALPREERFRKHGKEWRVRFTKAASGRNVVPEVSEASGLERQLIERGVSASVADELVRTFEHQRVRRQLEYFDFLSEHQKDKLTNPGGFLAESIRGNFQQPAGFRTKEQIAQASQKRAEIEEQKRSDRDAEQRRLTAVRQERERIAAFRDTLSLDQLAELEREAESLADEEAKRTLRSPQLGKVYLNVLVDTLIRDRYLDTSEEEQATHARSTESVVTA